ncbi:hypothetical protein LJK88_25300 [Paenibacillus sp. P26]|nr:hypothetical protein LJK88_25300 [Paenibacillus sp. P26]
MYGVAKPPIVITKLGAVFVAIEGGDLLVELIPGHDIHLDFHFIAVLLVITVDDRFQQFPVGTGKSVPKRQSHFLPRAGVSAVPPGEPEPALQAVSPMTDKAIVPDNSMRSVRLTIDVDPPFFPLVD